jgi:hypothetical protein
MSGTFEAGAQPGFEPAWRAPPPHLLSAQRGRSGSGASSRADRGAALCAAAGAAAACCTFLFCLALLAPALRAWLLPPATQGMSSSAHLLHRAR